MKKQVLYIHGGDVFSDYNKFLNYLQTKEVDPEKPKPKRWRETLTTELGTSHQLYAPVMPNKDSAKYKEWKIWFERYAEYLKDDCILLGSSLGAAFLMKYLCENELKFKPAALILIAGSVMETNEVLNEVGEDGGDFIFDASKLPILAEKVGEIHIFHSKDDFVVPYEHALKIQAALPAATLHTFEDRNHFLQEEFPELIQLIRSI